MVATFSLKEVKGLSWRLFFFSVFICSTCFKTVCWHDSHKNWRITRCIPETGWDWEAAHLCWNWTCALCLSTYWRFISSTYHKQAEQHSWRSGHSEADLQACILLLHILIFWFFGNCLICMILFTMNWNRNLFLFGGWVEMLT